MVIVFIATFIGLVFVNDADDGMNEDFVVVGKEKLFIGCVWPLVFVESINDNLVSSLAVGTGSTSSKTKIPEKKQRMFSI